MSLPPPHEAQRWTPDISLPSCGDILCNSRGSCVPSPDGGQVTVCDCLIGYTGEFCEDTMNKSISLPLTISVVIVIIVTIVIAFICAIARRKQQKRRRKAWAAEREGLNSRVVCVDSGESSPQEFEEKLST